ncbi:hypothetical protein ABPG74_013538 [Tetrahymena malaccensis]
MQQNLKQINKDEIKHFLLDENIQITPQFISKNYSFSEKDTQNTLLELLRENFDSLSVIYQLQLFRPRLPNITQIMKEEKLYTYLCAEDSLKDICSIKIQCLKKRYNQQPPKQYSIEDLANLMKGHNIFKVKAQTQQSQSVNGSQSQQSKKKKPEGHEEISKSEFNNSQKLISEYQSTDKSDKSKQDSQSQNNTPQQKNINLQQQKIKIVKNPTKQNQQQKQQNQPLDYEQDSDCMIIEPF